MFATYSRRHSAVRPEKLNVNWNTWSPIKHERENLIRNSHVVKEYMDALEIPGWYRGLSPLQLSKVRELNISLLDDHLQGTTYRVRAVLSALGLYPIPSNKLIYQLIKISSGSDFAFLWFLMEAAYHVSDEHAYNINEQIILSCIADMDLAVTLKALDELLPPGTLNTAKKEAKPKKPKCSRKDFTMNYPNLDKDSPYFARQRLPVFRKSNLQFCHGIKYSLEPFKKTDDEVRSGNKWIARRWFKNYKFGPNQRIVHAIIRDKINEIFDDFESLKVSTEKLTVLCKHHEDMRLLTESVEAKLEVLEKERVSNASVRKQQLLESLQKEIERNRQKFREELTKCRQQTIMKILSTDTHESYDTERIGSEIISGNMRCKSSDEGAISAASSGYDLCEGRCMITEDLLSTPIKSRSDMDINERNSIRNFKKQFLNPKSYYGLKCCDCNNGICKFDYRKIFKLKENTDESMRMKQALIEAVDSDIGLLNQLEREWAYCDGDDKAVSRTTEKIWNKELDNYQLMVQEQLAKCPLGLEYKQSYYDPNDDKLMDRMLKDAVDYLRNDPKYVLLSLPGVHRLPVLKEWIRLRYGKIYTCKEQRDKFESLEPIFRAMPVVTLSVALPTVAQVFKTQKHDYRIHDILVEKSRDLRCNTYEKMDETILAQSRVFYFAMHPLPQMKSLSDNTFFAYLPTHKRNLQYFKPWKEFEVRKLAKRACGVSTLKRPLLAESLAKLGR